MASLSVHLAELETWLRRQDAPPWIGMLMVEDRDIAYAATNTIRRSALHTTDAYENAFTAHMAAGYSWLNLSALGVMEGMLVVCVELPREAVGAYGRTKVAFSGPPLDRTAMMPLWDASASFHFTD